MGEALSLVQKKQQLYDMIGKFYTDTLPTGEALLDDQFVQQVSMVKDYLVREKMAFARVSALIKLGYGISPQARTIRAIVAPLLKSASEIAQSYRDALQALKEQTERSVDLWFNKNKKQIEGYSAYDWARLSVLGLPLVLYFSGGLGALSVRQFLVSSGSKSVAALYIGQLFSDVLSDPISSLYSGANVLLADWWLKPKDIKDASGLSERDFRKVYYTKVAELQKSTDSNLRALAVKLDAAYLGQETGPAAWTKRNWVWLTVGSIVAIALVNPIKDRG